MGVREYLIGGLIVLLSAAALGWRAQIIKTAQRDAVAEIYAERNDSLRALVSEQIQAIAARDSAALDLARERNDALEQVEIVTRAAALRRPEIVERIVHAPDTTAIRAAVEELEEVHEEEVTVLRSALAVSDSLLRVRELQIADRDAALQAKDALIANLEGQVAAMHRPGFFDSLGGKFIAGAVGYGVGKLAESAFD